MNKDLVGTVEIPFPDKNERKKIIEKLKRLLKELKDKKEQLKTEIQQKEKEIDTFMEKEILS